MNIGYETITWGIRIASLADVLQAIADAGFRGVEIAQRFDSIGVESFAHLQDMVRSKHLRLLGLVGGSLREKLDFCSAPGASLEYLYIEPWELDKFDDIDEARRRGLVTALHPRVFTPLSRSEDFLPALSHDRLRSVKLLLDTAHIYLAGEDPVSTIRARLEQVAAVHLKDWTPVYGRSSYRYGRGFIELGDGVVDLEAVIGMLQRQNFPGWLVAEVDRPSVDPFDALDRCAAWLRQRGLLPSATPARKTTSCKPPDDANYGASRFARVEDRFTRSLMAAAINRSSSFYNEVARTFAELADSSLVTVWACSLQQDRMMPVGMFSREPVSYTPPEVVSPRETLTGLAIYRHLPVLEVDIDPAAVQGAGSEHPPSAFLTADVIRQLGLRRVTTLPIYNSGNQNYVRLLVNMYSSQRGPRLTEGERAHIHTLGQLVTAATDLVLDRRCAEAVGQVGLLASRAATLHEFSKSLAHTIREELKCEGTTVFVVNGARDRLMEGGSTGIKWPGWEHQKWYSAGEGLTGRAWRRREPVITPDATKELYTKAKSAEDVVTPKRHVSLLVPLVDARGDGLGVVRCRNKVKTEGALAGAMFSDDDAAILDAFCQAAVPHLQMLMSDARSATVLEAVSHELRWVVAQVRNAFLFLEASDATERDRDMRELESLISLMRLVVQNSRAAGSLAGAGSRPRAVDFEREVLDPVLKDTKALVMEYWSGGLKVERLGLDRIPKIWIDPDDFQLLAFNVISNAIKYGRGRAEERRLLVVGERQGDDVWIRWQDFGMGIHPDLRERVFEFGVRAAEAVSRVKGAGLGLWVVRQIIGRYGGQVTVSQTGDPTEISMRFRLDKRDERGRIDLAGSEAV